jgi:hypothetical protein
MTWVRIDDQAPLHPKLLSVSDGAFRLWVNATAHCNRAHTDGLIADHLVPTLDHCAQWGRRKTMAFAQELVDAKLWEPVPEGFRIHDYEHHQEEALKVNVEAKREDARLRKREQRARDRARKVGIGVPMSRCDTPVTGHVTSRVTPPVTSAVTEPVTGMWDGADLRPGVSQPPDPARPVPVKIHHNNSLSPGSESGPVVVAASSESKEGGKTCDVGYVVRAFSHYWQRATGCMPMALNEATEKTGRRAQAVIQWAHRTMPDDPCRAVRASAEAFATSKGNDPSVARPFELWTYDASCWLGDREATCRTAS